MTADSALDAATFLPKDASCRRPDPVRARISAGQQLVNSQSLPADSQNPGHEAAHRSPDLTPDYRASGRRKPHPGDVLYWVACLGGACLLLIKATT